MPDVATTKLKDFFQAGTLFRFKRGDVILLANEEPAGVYYIEQGHVKVYSIRNSGENNMHIIYGNGELFPLIWAYRGQKPSVFYEALDDVVLRCIGREEFKKFSRQDLDVSNL